MPKRSSAQQRRKETTAAEEVSVAHWPPTQEDIEALPREFAKDHQIPLDVVLQLLLPVNHDTLVYAGSVFNSARDLPDYTPRFGSDENNAFVSNVRLGIKRRFKAAKQSGDKQEARACWKEWKLVRNRFYSTAHMPRGWEGPPWHTLFESMNDVISYVENCLEGVQRFCPGSHRFFKEAYFKRGQAGIRNTFRALKSIGHHMMWPEAPMSSEDVERMLANLLLELRQTMSNTATTIAIHQDWQPPERQPSVDDPMPTNHSDRVAALAEEGCEDGIDLIEESLNHQPLAIYRLLKGYKYSIQYDTLRDYAHLWRKESPSDETIQRALLRLQSDLNSIANAPHLSIEHDVRRLSNYFSVNAA